MKRYGNKDTASYSIGYKFICTEHGKIDNKKGKFRLINVSDDSKLTSSVPISV